LPISENSTKNQRKFGGFAQEILQKKRLENRLAQGV